MFESKEWDGYFADKSLGTEDAPAKDKAWISLFFVTGLFKGVGKRDDDLHSGILASSAFSECSEDEVRVHGIIVRAQKFLLSRHHISPADFEDSRQMSRPTL